MKITNCERFSYFYITTDEKEYNTHRRDENYPNWETLMGESWESYYNSDDLEEAYQEYLKRHNDNK